MHLIFSALVICVMCAIDCYVANKHINEENDRNSADYTKQKLPTAPTFFISFAAFLLLIAFVLYYVKGPLEW